MGVFNFILLALFAIGSCAIHIPNQHNDGETTNKISLNGKKWVVLVAGSKGWANYRHQADICHAYQIMRRNGIPKENIITMMVDDIAYNLENPQPGKIINKPNGTDVYGGVEIDYKGADVTPENFLNIITGNKTAMTSIGSGKVVDGGHWDTVFINFVDHGGTGLLVFPRSYLFADELINALNSMYQHKLCKKALLYIEACEAGSMFDGLISDDTNVLAITASGPRESSWGCYCDEDSDSDSDNETEIYYYDTCLGDLFSVTWMENLDDTKFSVSEKKRSIFNDFKEVRTNVTLSNVMMYGDFDIGHEKISTFIGYSKNEGTKQSSKSTNKYNSKSTMTKKTSFVPSRDIEETIIQSRIANKKEKILIKQELAMKLRRNNEMRQIIDGVLRNIHSKTVKMRPDIKEEIGEFDKPLSLELSMKMFPCYRSILNKITEVCFSMPQNPYVLSQLKIFANLCIVDKEIDKFVISVVDETCLDIPKNIINVF